MSKEEKKNLKERSIKAAEAYLLRRDYEVLETGWTCDVGGFDVIAEEGNTIVFVTVQVRTYDNDSQGCPDGRLDIAKSESAAAVYFACNDRVDCTFRFDVISMLVIAEDRALLRHHINAVNAQIASAADVSA